jgi:hypothetical protein
MHVDDVMFINQRRLVSLEAIFYNFKDGTYHKMEKIKDNRNMLGTNHFVSHNLENQAKAFTTESSNYEVPDEEYLYMHDGNYREETRSTWFGRSKSLMAKKDQAKFLETASGDVKVEILISAYKI